MALEAASVGPGELNPKTQSSVHMKSAQQILLPMGDGAEAKQELFSEGKESRTLQTISW